MSQDSGTISLDGDLIRYRSQTYGNWDLAVGEIRVIGEATNQNGPLTDDYFLCFASGPGMWKEASFYATGCEDFLEALSQRLGLRIELGLASSTDFASRILWPPELVGQAMFKFVDVAPRGLIRKLFGLGRNHQSYSDGVKRVLGSAGPTISQRGS